MGNLFTDLDHLVERRLIVTRIKRLAADPAIKDATATIIDRRVKYEAQWRERPDGVYDELAWFHVANVGGWNISDMAAEVARMYSGFRGMPRRKSAHETDFSSTRPAWMSAHISSFPEELSSFSWAFVRWAGDVLGDLAWRAKPNVLRAPGMLMQDSWELAGLTPSWAKPRAVIEVLPKIVFAVRKLDQDRKTYAYRFAKLALQDYAVATAKLDAYKKASGDMMVQRDTEKDLRHAFDLLYALRDSLDDIRPILAADPQVLQAKKKTFRKIIGEVIVSRLEYFTPSDAVLQLLNGYVLGAIARNHPHVIRFEDYRWVCKRLRLLV